MVEAAGIEPGEGVFFKSLSLKQIQLKAFSPKNLGKSYPLSGVARICWSFPLK